MPSPIRRARPEGDDPIRSALLLSLLPILMAAPALSQAPCTTADGAEGRGLFGGCTPLDAPQIEIAARELTDSLSAFRDARKLTVAVNATDATDISALAAMPGLTSVIAARIPATDLAPLAGLTGLTQLGIGLGDGADLSPLSALPDLRWLSLGGAGPRDLSPLSGRRRLTILILTGGADWDASRLTDLPALTDLTVIGGFTPPDPAQVPRLSRVTLFDGDWRDLAPLCRLPLVKLSLDALRVPDLSGLAGCTALQELSIHGMGARDLSPLAGLTALRRLSLNGTRPRSLAPLTSLPALEYLALHGAAPVSGREAVARALAAAP